MGFRVLAALLVVHAAALYLFTTGFFLTRFEVSDLSSCQTHPSDANDIATHLRSGHDDAIDGATPGCWMPRRFRRVVFVVIDALRFDFAATNTNSRWSEFYSDRLSIINDTLTSEPEHALLLKFVADPPTMTMQRLKGLTTGSLPTFLDIKDNMAASSQIVEDNLLRQLQAQHRGVVFMGDDTWDALYAREFTRKFAFDSFNVKDLHSVDRGVTAHLFPELEKSDWDLLIAHFLGVDHVGHTHGPSSVFMAEKLDEMNSLLKRLLQTLKRMPDGEDVLLAVLGDHGMSADGNHGGASDEETGAALFLYSKTSLVATGSAEDNEEAKALKHFAEKLLDSSREVPQVDLVPTLALLSGLPIPFGNLGSVIPSLFFVPPLSMEKGENSVLAAFQTLNRALKLNLDQVRRYLFRYSSASKLPEQAYDQLEKLYDEIKRIEQRLEQVQKSKTGIAYSKADLPLLLRLHQNLVKQQQTYLREALSLGRSIWTQFDLCNMSWGMLLLIWAFLIGASFTRVATIQSEVDVIWSPPLGAIAGVSGLLVICPANINLPFLPAAPTLRGLVAGACAILIDMSYHLVSRRSFTSIQHTAISVKTSLVSISAAGMVAATVVILHALALLSNSYIVAEGNVMQFLSTTIGIFMFLCAQRLHSTQKTATGAALAFIFATRSSSALEPPNIIKTSATLERTFVPLVTIAVLAVGSSVQAIRYTSQKLSFSGWLILASSMASYSICAIFWAASPINLSFWRLWLPRFIYLIFLGTLVYLLVSIVRAKHQVGNKAIGSAIVEHQLLLWQFIPAYMIVLGPTSPLSMLCLVVQFKSFAFVVTSHRSTCPTAFQDVTPWVVLWASCSYQAFFTSGHANTFSSLQNAAGFVGFDTFNFFTAGALLGLNTFGCFAFAVLALPWLNLNRYQSRPGCAEMLLTFSTYFTLNTLVSTLFVALQRRHLMVWAIFAPKFIFDGVVLLTTELMLLVLLAPFQSTIRDQEVT